MTSKRHITEWQAANVEVWATGFDPACWLRTLDVVTLKPGEREVDVIQELELECGQKVRLAYFLD